MCVRRDPTPPPVDVPRGPLTGGATVPVDVSSMGGLREASWLDLPRRMTNIAPTGPRILRWQVAMSVTHLWIDAYVGTAGRHTLSEDALVVLEEHDSVVLAVADGVTPSPNTPAVAGMNGARHAAVTVLDHVSRHAGNRDLTWAFEQANKDLIDRFGPHARPDLHRRDRPQAAAVAVRLRIGTHGQVAGADVLRAADCDVWVREGTRWSLVTTTPMFRERTRRAIDEWAAAHPNASFAERLDMERSVITGRECWNLTALGRFDIPKLRRRTIDGGFDELVLVTDGPQVRRAVAGGMSEPSQWLTTLRSWEQDNRPQYKRHDDVAMLHVRNGGRSRRGDQAGTLYLKT